jgi:hypothetical protein
MHYNVVMKSPDPRVAFERAARVLRLIELLDPRVVRLREPGGHASRNAALIAVAVALTIAGAAAVAATGDGGEDRAASGLGGDFPSRIPNASVRPVAEPERWSAKESSRATRDAGDGPSGFLKRPGNFYDPLYVFTDEPALGVVAYPMADPPGLVVNLDGLLEPLSDARDMVGADPRVRAVTRRTSPSGVRYVIGLSVPIKRIEILHEGNVVIISPVS